MAKLNVKPAASSEGPKEEQKSESTLNMDFVDQQLDTLEGFEQVTQQTMAIPFLRVLQKLSPQLDRNKPEFIPGAQEGQWFNTITKAVYGSKVLCVVLKFENIYIEWQPNRGGFVDYHSPEHAAKLDVTGKFGKWKTESGNILQETYAYMVLVEGHEHEGPMVLSLSSSAIKEAKQWNRLMMTHVLPNGKRAMPYYLVWELRTEYRSNDKGNWYSPHVTFSGYIGKQVYEVAVSERKMLPMRKVDYRQLESSQAQSTEPSEY